MTTLAEQYAAAHATEMAALSAVEATIPPSWTGPGGLMMAMVTYDGQAAVTFMNVSHDVPPAVLLAFADWTIATFRTPL